LRREVYVKYRRRLYASIHSKINKRISKIVH
jgi:hypothetical protein